MSHKKLKFCFSFLKDISKTLDVTSPNFMEELKKTDILDDLKQDGAVGFFLNGVPVVASYNDQGVLEIKENKDAYED